MEGDGVICSAVDILPTEFAKEASQHFGDILSHFIGSLASLKDTDGLPAHLERACIAHDGALTSLYAYIPRMRNSDLEDISENLANSNINKKEYTILVSLSGHLFDQFLINEALDIIEASGGSFHLVKCQVGQSTDAMSYSELEVGADDSAVLDKIINSLTSISTSSENLGFLASDTNMISLKLGKVRQGGIEEEYDMKKKHLVLILGAGRVCQPAVELLTSIGSISSRQWLKSCIEPEFEEQNCVEVIVASLYLKDAEEIIKGIPNAVAVQLDIMDHGSLYKYISQVAFALHISNTVKCHI
ncbi:unnamed protein product [Ilex paraguariensis]|uniref:LOR/SDH bifunctional enzyme conserved domain-containing protein n=1 Tax=Ilex paraguariensis TaxID=185542 RepID=A0ABC8RJR3_9AQUA